jgi:hypothetical protein
MEPKILIRITGCGVAHSEVRRNPLGVKVWHVADKGFGVAHVGVRHNSLWVKILRHNS